MTRWIKKLFGRTGIRPISKKNRQSYCPQLEALEDRQLMAAGASIISGVLTVVGTDAWSELPGSASDKILVGPSSNPKAASVTITDRDTGALRYTGTVTLASFSSVKIMGLAGDDYIVCSLSKPTNIFGGIGSDYLKGGSGHDNLYGEAGNDRLEIGPGSDSPVGATGNDTYVFSSSAAGTVIIPEAADVDNDTLDFSALNFGVRVDLAGVRVDLAAGYVTQAVVPGVLSIILSSGGKGIENVIGTPFADHIFGNSRVNYIEGRDGNDELSGGMGNDLLLGGLGSDTYRFDDHVGDLGTDQIFEAAVASVDTLDFSNFSQGIVVDLGSTATQQVAAGRLSLVLSTDTGIENLVGSEFGDQVTGNSNANRLEGLGGHDTIKGMSGEDDLFGGSGDDRLEGGEGDDRLEGGYGDDELFGGLGEDLYVFGNQAGSLGHDTIEDQNPSNCSDKPWWWGYVYGDICFGNVSANDWLDFSQFGRGITLDLMRTDVQTLHADLHLTLNTPRYIKGVWGTDGNDIIYGNDADNFLYGAGGIDVLWGHGGNDTLIGGAGADQLYGEKGNDYLIGGFWYSNLDGAVDVLVGGEDADTFYAEWVKVYYNGQYWWVNRDQPQDYDPATDSLTPNAPAL